MVKERTPRKSAGCIDWEKLYDRAENPKGATFQTANGTARATGLGWNQQLDPFYELPASERGPWQAPNSNRTGE